MGPRPLRPFPNVRRACSCAAQCSAKGGKSLAATSPEEDSLESVSSARSLYGAPPLYRVGSYGSVALNTALGILTACVALFAARPSEVG